MVAPIDYEEFRTEINKGLPGHAKDIAVSRNLPRRFDGIDYGSPFLFIQQDIETQIKLPTQFGYAISQGLATKVLDATRAARVVDPDWRADLFRSAVVHSQPEGITAAYIQTPAEDFNARFYLSYLNCGAIMAPLIKPRDEEQMDKQLGWFAAYRELGAAIIGLNSQAPGKNAACDVFAAMMITRKFGDRAVSVIADIAEARLLGVREILSVNDDHATDKAREWNVEPALRGAVAFMKHFDVCALSPEKILEEACAIANYALCRNDVTAEVLQRAETVATDFKCARPKSALVNAFAHAVMPTLRAVSRALFPSPTPTPAP